MNNYSVITLYDDDNNVAGYAAGTNLSDLVSTGWTPTASPGTALSALQAVMISDVQAMRANAETAGIMVGGNVFATDPASQTKYVGILFYASMNPAYVGEWSSVNNGFVTMNASQVSILCEYVMAYIQLCYAWEASIVASINAATTVSQLQLIDLSGVPNGALPSEMAAAIDASGGVIGAGTISPNGVVSSGLVSAPKFECNSGTPSVATGDAAGTAGSAVLAAGSSDAAGQVSITPAGSSVSTSTGSVIAGITFSAPYATTPFVVISAANMPAGSLANMPYVSATPTSFSIMVSNNSGLDLSSTYAFNYMILSGSS